MKLTTLQKKEKAQAAASPSVADKKKSAEPWNEQPALAGMPLFLQSASSLSGGPPPVQRFSSEEDEEDPGHVSTGKTAAPSETDQAETEDVKIDDMTSGPVSFIQRQPEKPDHEPDEEDTFPVRPKTNEGTSSDPFEREADRVADMVMEYPESSHSPIQEKESNSSVQTHDLNGSQASDSSAYSPGINTPKSKINNLVFYGGSPSSNSLTSSEHVRTALQSSGQGIPLPFHVRSRIEAVLNTDLSEVSVHDSTVANQAAESIHAKAFTHRDRIFLGPGQSSQDTALMAHEAAHVVQQSQSCHCGAAQPQTHDYITYTQGDVTIHIWPKLGQMGATLAGEPWVAIQWSPMQTITPSITTKSSTSPQAIGLDVKAPYHFRVTLNRNAERKYVRQLIGTVDFIHEFKAAGHKVTVNEHLDQMSRSTTGEVYITRRSYQGEESPIMENPEIPLPAEKIPPRPDPRPFHWKFDTLKQLQAFVAVHPHHYWGEFAYNDTRYIAVALDEKGMQKLANAFRQDPGFPLVRVYSNGSAWKSTDTLYEKYYASDWQAANGAPGDAKECLVYKHDKQSFGRKPLSHNEAINTWGFLEFFGGPHKYRIPALEGREFVALYVDGRSRNHRIDGTYFTARNQFFILVKQKEQLMARARGLDVGQSWEDMMQTFIPGQLTIWYNYLGPALDREEAIIDDKLKKVIDTHPGFVEAAGERILKKAEDIARDYTYTMLDGAIKGLKMFYSDRGAKNFIDSFLHHMNARERNEALEYINVPVYFRPFWIVILSNPDLAGRVMMNENIGGVSIRAIQEHASSQADELLKFRIHIMNGDVEPLHMEGDFGYAIRKHVYDLLGFNLHPRAHPHEHDAEARQKSGGQRFRGSMSLYGSEAGYLYAQASAALARSKRRKKYLLIGLVIVASVFLVLIAAELGLLLAGLFFAGKTALVVGFAIELAIITLAQPALTTFIMSEGKATAEDYKKAYDDLGEQALINLITMGIFRYIGWLTRSWAILKAGSRQALKASTRIRTYEFGLRFGLSSITAFNISILVHAIKKGEIPKGTPMYELLIETALSMVLMEIGGALNKPLSGRIQMYARKARLGKYVEHMDSLQLKMNDLNKEIASYSVRPHRMVGKGKGLAERQAALLTAKKRLLIKMKKSFRTRPDAKALEPELNFELRQIDNNLQKLEKVGYMAEAEIRPETLATEEVRFRYKRGTEKILEKFYGKENVVKKKGHLEVTTPEGHKLIFRPSTKLHPELGFSGTREPRALEAWRVHASERQLKLLKRADALAETSPELKKLAKAKPHEMEAKQLRGFERTLAKAELHISKAEAASTQPLEMRTEQNFDSIHSWRLRLVEVRGNLLKQAELLGQSKHPYVEQMRQLPTKRKNLKANTLKRHAEYIERARKIIEAGRTERFRSIAGQKTTVAEPDMAPLQKQLNRRKYEVLRRAKFYGATGRKYIRDIVGSKIGSRKKFESLREAESMLEKAEQNLDRMALGTLQKAEAVLGKETLDAARSEEFSEMSDIQVGDALRQLGVTGKLSVDALRGLFHASMAPPKSSGSRTHIPIQKMSSLARTPGELVFVLETFGQMREAGIKGTYKVLRDSLGGKGKWKGGVWQMELVRFRFGIDKVKALEVKMTSDSGNREVDIYLHDGRKIEAKDWDVMKISTIEDQFQVDVDIATRGGTHPEGIRDTYWMFRYSKGVNIGKIRSAMSRGLERFIAAKTRSGDITQAQAKALRKALAEHGSLVEIPKIERTKVQPPRPSGRTHRGLPVPVPDDNPDPDRKTNIRIVPPSPLIQPKGHGKKELSHIAPEFGSDARRFERGISGIFTARSNATAGSKDKQDGTNLFSRGPKPVDQKSDGPDQVPAISLSSIYEQQADEVADKVQRKSDTRAKDNMAKIQTGSSLLHPRSSQSHAALMTPSVKQVIQVPGNGNPVEQHLREQAESILGHDLGRVRIHQNPDSHEAARSIHAKAFTHGNNIYLGKGQSSHDPGLMAHELTHVVQQGYGGESGNPEKSDHAPESL